MQKNIFEYENLPENFNMSDLTEKIRYELTSMDYSVTVNCENTKAEFWVEKDITPMDMFLGRWQKFRATLTRKESNLTLEFDNKNIADKIVCYVIGIFFFFIPYLFCFIANGNRKEIQKVFEKIVDNYIIKKKSEFADQQTDI